MDGKKGRRAQKTTDEEAEMIIQAGTNLDRDFETDIPKRESCLIRNSFPS